jgi:hypothetical protein
MTLEEFRASLNDPDPAANLPPLLAAMWWDARADWNRAHELAQDVGSAEGAWVHAYLHRKEGDAGNASYWYGHADKPDSRLPHDAEWEEIVRALLASDAPSPK